MKYINENELDQISGRRLAPGEQFGFRCHSDLACFNQCCRNLNLFLYPYDVLRLRRQLEISSDEFIERYVDLVLRKEQHFPEVLLRMADNQEHTCPFLSPQGCSVYPDRPDTCRTFPVEQGALYDAATGHSKAVSYLRPPDFCLGQLEDQQWTTDTWAKDQEAAVYNQMTMRWAEIRSLFQKKPWGAEGPNGPKAKMAFMAVYNIDSFREFIFGSSFLKRYKVKSNLKLKIRKNDKALLLFGFEWIKSFIWGLPSKQIRPK